jgi:phosphatidate phosphatase APP1
MVVDPQAHLGIVSDIDDTVLHTGLTRLREALRTTLLVAEEQRLPIPGAAAFYAGLVAGDEGRAPVFYVSTGAWNLHTMLERFLTRHRFPSGPMLMTDWGPGGAWLFREDSIAFKSRTILALVDLHPQLRWVLIGDSGQHDPEAYAAVARARPGRLRAIYIREVPPQTPARARRVRELAGELANQGVPMLLVSDSAVAADHAGSLGLLDDLSVARVRETVRAAG